MNFWGKNSREGTVARRGHAKNKENLFRYLKATVDEITVTVILK